MKKGTFATFLCCTLSLAFSHYSLAEAYGSGWYGEMQFSYEREDNVNRTFKDEDQASDLITSISFGGGYSRKIGVSSQLLFTGYVTYNDYETYEDLDNLATALGINWVYQPQVGYTSFWYGVAANATALNYRDSEAREGVVFDLDLNINRRLLTTLVGHLGYRYMDMVFLGKSKDDKSRDAAFDTDAHEIYLGIDYSVTPSVYLFGEYGFRHGDLTSTLSGLRDPNIHYDAETEDPVFDDCGGNPRCVIGYAGRAVGDTHRWNSGIAFPLGPVNMDLTASYFDSEADNGEKYKDWMVKLGLLWNF